MPKPGVPGRPGGVGPRGQILVGLLRGAGPWLTWLLAALKGKKAGGLLVIMEAHSSKHAV